MSLVFTTTSSVRRDRQPLGHKPKAKTPIPTLRRSLPANQRNTTRKQYAVRPAAADVVKEEDMRDTDNLAYVEQEDPITRPEETIYPPQQVLIPVQPRQAFPWLRFILWAIAVMVVLWAIVQGVLTVIDFVTDVRNTFEHGPTRTTVVSGVFFDHDSATNQTQVVVVNLHGNLLIEVVPAGDIAKTKVYPTGLTLVGNTAAKAPVQLTVKDLNGDHKPDVLLEIPDQGISMKLINTGTTFALSR